MNFNIGLKKYLLTLLVICAATLITVAQTFRFTTAVNTNTIAMDEMVHIQFMLENPVNLSQFTPPQFTGFNVVQGPQQMQGSSYVNGKGTEYIAFSYILQPTKPGSFTIPGGTARVDGKLVKSNPVNIEVVKGGQGAQLPQQQQQPYQRRAFPDNGYENQPGILKKGEDVKEKLRKNLFVRVDVDKTTVYEGEQLTATYKLYTRLPTNSSVTKVPAFKGFSARDIELPNPPQATEEIVNGERYKVFTIRKTLLFPLQSGQLELDPAEVDNQVHLVTMASARKKRGDDPFRDAFGASPFDDPFFDDPFGNPQYEVVPYKIQSPVVKINVKPLPTAGRPASFNGAVGRFTMTAVADKKDLSTDDALTLKVTIAGQGNVNLLNPPPLNIPTAFEKYDPTLSDNIEKNSNPLSGSRIFQYVLMPQEKGEHTLPPVEFSYFDPAANAYKVLQSSAFPLHVIAGKLAKKEKEDFGGKTELGNIRTSGQRWSKHSPFFFGKPLFWILLLLPLLGVAGMAWYRKRENFRQSNVAMLKHKHANKVALKRLELAARYLKEGKDKAFYEETSRATWGYLSHKLKIPMAELSKQVVQDKLGDRLKETTKLQLIELIDRCETALYAPVSSNEHRQDAYQQAVQVISSVEEELKGRAGK
ncbi:BatD family protein [Chitinophaga niabensis]|uniref:Oxygen tolerance n=1 Tax=Chitinophaga niabensis TaxID=536979 RepID=A0A1N6JRZ3_9BACT|nr:BatD family protein [Chitinophaga niabensis]SIO47164.1 Oxygen tolerance [Chitinophaga niabensis]